MDRVKIVRYEELTNNTEYELKKIFDFCDIKFSPSTYTFIENSQKYTVNDPYSVYREKNLCKKYKRSLGSNIIEIINCDFNKDGNT